MIARDKMMTIKIDYHRNSFFHLNIKKNIEAELANFNIRSINAIS